MLVVLVYMDMIDENMEVWLIEINDNIALTTNTNTLVQESICKMFHLLI